MRELRAATGELNGRVWDGELPVLTSPIAALLQETFPAAAPGIGARRAAVEWWRHLGPVYRYGLLGAAFTPAPAPGHLHVEVAVTAEAGPAVPWALPLVAFPDVEAVAAGLPRPFAEGVLQGVRGAAQRSALGAGWLRFACAAHSPISSATAVFEGLAAYVLTVLVHGDPLRER